MSETFLKLKNNKAPFSDKTTSASNNQSEISTDKIDNILEVEFEWTEGGKEVFLSGNFISWDKRYLMKKEKDKFVLKLNLSEGEYKYKFIVDGQWKIDESKQKCKENDGVENNIIKVKFPQNIQIISSSSLKDNKNSNQNFDKEKEQKPQPKTKTNLKKSKNKNKNKTQKNEEEGYGCNYDDLSIMKPIPPKCPLLYNHHYNFSNLKNYSFTNESFGEMQKEKVPNIYYNHLMINKFEKTLNYISTSMTTRNSKNKGKLLTMIFYSPLNH